MNSLISFIKSFLKRDGLSVLISTFLIKFIGMISSVLIVRILSQDAYGSISFAISIVGVLAAFEGLGSTYSLLRYGSRLSSNYDKYNLYRYSLKKGLLYSLLFISIIILLIILFLPNNLKDSVGYIVILSCSIFTGFCFNLSLSYFRIIGRNKVYSFANVIGSLITSIFVIAFAYFLKGYGYVIALTCAPLITFLYFRRRLLIKGWGNSKIIKLKDHYTFSDKSFFQYGIHTGLGAVANLVTITAGPIIAGFLNATTTDLALFKVATIIPFNLMIFPTLIMTTDFVYISKNSSDPHIIKNYYVQYLKSIIAIFTIPFIILLYFNKDILTLLYGNTYQDAATMSLVLIISVYLSFLLRIPLGNMLSAVGKANWNSYHSIAWFIFVIPCSIIFYNIWGIAGVAYSIAIVLGFSGFVTLFLFSKYLKEIKDRKL